MKKIITLVCYLSTAVLFAQEKGNTFQIEETKPNWSIILSKLDTTQIKSGILYNKVTPFANLELFNSSNDHNISSYEHFIQSFSELYRASNKQKFSSVLELKERIISEISRKKVPVAIISTRFEMLNYTEKLPEKAGVNWVENHFEPIEGKPSFVSRNVLVAAPLQSTAYGREIVFSFSDALFFKDSQRLKQLTVGFDDGREPESIIEDGVIVKTERVTSYDKSGYRMIQFNAEYEDGAKMTTYGEINIQMDTQDTADLCSEVRKEKGVHNSTIEFQGYNETAPINGRIEYTVFYSDNNLAKKMIQPIIIVDGFDAGDKRKVQDCDCESDQPCRDDPSHNDCSTVWNPLPHKVCHFNPEKHDSIEESMDYDGFSSIGAPQKNHLLPELRTLGYDVVVINNPTYTTPQGKTIDGGADYIERNGRTLASFIKDYVQVKQNDAGSTDPLVLIGPSMGGQITRYALAYMEKKFAETGLPEWKHNARLWVSVDSPHHGANIPMGAQANLWFLGEGLGKEEAKTRYDSQLNSVASKQMTISQFQNVIDTYNGNIGYSNNAPFFNTYYSNIDNNGVAGSGGYPVSTASFRKIAMVNGSLTGKKHSSEGQKFLDMRAYININPLALASGGLVGAALLTDFFDNLFGSSNNIEINMLKIKDYNTPAFGSSGTAFRGSGFNSNNFTYPGMNLICTTNDVRGSLDVAPGGLFKTAKYIREGVEEGARKYFLATETNQPYIEDHSFISSFSAIGHLNQYQDWSNPLNTNLTCPTNIQTPFDSYYGSSDNTGHITFSNEGVKWLKKELTGTTPQAPWFPLVANDLSGPETICIDNTTVSYSFGDVCKIPSPATFTVSDNLEIVGTPSATEVTVRGTANGEGTITVHFQDSDQTVVKKVWVGLPDAGSITCDSAIGSSMFCSGQVCHGTMDLPEFSVDSMVAVNNVSGLKKSELGQASNYIWERINDNILISTLRNKCYIAPNIQGLTGVRVKVHNTCGWSEWSELYFNIVDCGYNYNKSAQNLFRIFPNPTSDVVNVMLADENKLPVNTSTITAELFDMMEQSKGSVSVLNNTASINVAALPKGIYVLKIYIDGTVEYHQVAVQ